MKPSTVLRKAARLVAARRATWALSNDGEQNWYTAITLVAGNNSPAHEWMTGLYWGEFLGGPEDNDQRELMLLLAAEFAASEGL